MPAKDLGNKFTCFKCGTKFYDLKKAEPVCPKCGADQRESPALKAPTTERRSRAKPPPAPEPKVEEVELDTELEDDLEADDDAEDDAGADDES
jgi:uncharacterized protein (TIGR02300 family)